VVAVAGGTVCYVQESIPDETVFSGAHAGNIVIIVHEGTCSQYTNGNYSLYAHLKYNSVPVSAGQVIKGGDVIGYFGRSGYAGGDHLHFSANSQYYVYTKYNWETAAGPTKPATFSDDDVRDDGGVPKAGQSYISDNPPSACCGCLPAACCGYGASGIVDASAANTRAALLASPPTLRNAFAQTFSAARADTASESTTIASGRVWGTKPVLGYFLFNPDLVDDLRIQAGLNQSQFADVQDAAIRETKHRLC